MAVKVVIEGDAASVLSAFKTAGDAATHFGQQVSQADEKGKGFSGTLSNIAGVAGGILGAGLISNLAGNIVGLGQAAFGAVAKNETMVNSIKNLVAVEKIRDSMQEKVIGTTTARLELTTKEQAQLGQLHDQYTKINATLAVHEEAYNKAVASKKKSAAELNLMRVNLQQERDKLGEVTSAISTLEGKEGQLITTTQKSRQATIDMATAKKMAASEAEGLLKWIKQLAIASPFSQEDIAKGFKVAMGFNFTAKEAQALTQDLTDLSAGMGLEGSAIDSIMRQLGQAKGKGKLMSSDLMVISEAGGPVTEALSSIGKSLADVEKGTVSVGEFTGAFQKVIRQNFAGAAAASGDSLQGMMASLGDLKEEIVRTFATPVIEAFRKPLSDFVVLLQDPKVTASIAEWGVGLGKMASDGVAQIGNLVTTVSGLVSTFQSGGAGGLAKALGLSPDMVDIVSRIASLLGSLAGGAQALFKGDISGAAADFSNAIFSIGKATSGLQESLVGGIQAAIPAIVAKLTELGQKFVAFIGPIIPPLLGELAKLYIQMEGWLISTQLKIVGQLVLWGQKFIGWIAPIIPPLIAELEKLGQQALSWLAAEAPIILNQLNTWGQQFVDFIAPFIPPFLDKMGELKDQFLSWIAGQAPIILEQLGDWAQSFIAMAVTTIPKFLDQWPGMLDQFLVWIEASAGPILQQLGEWATSFIVWIAPMIPPFLAALAGLLAAIVIWIAETAIVLAKHFVEKWAPAFMNWFEDTKRQALQKTMEFGASIGEEIHNQAVIMLGKAAEIGSGIISGISTALDAGLEGLKSKARDIVNSIVQAAKDALGIKSPSTVFYEIGENIASGLAVGILAGSGTVQDALSAMIPGIAQLPLALQERNALDKNLKDFLAVNNQKITAENERHAGAMKNINEEWAVIDGNYQQWRESDYQARYLENQRHDARMAQIVGEGEEQTAARNFENLHHSNVMRDLDDIAKVKEYNYHNDSRNHNIAVTNENTLHDTRMVNLAAVAEAAQKNHDTNMENLDKEIEKLRAVRDAAIAARAAPGDYRGIAFGGALGGASGAGSLTLPWGAGIPGLAGSSAGIRALAQAFSPGAMGVGGRNDVQHQINVAEDSLKELQKISANLDQRDKEDLRINEKNTTLLEKLAAGQLSPGDPEFVAAIILSRSLVNALPGSPDDPDAALRILKEQATQIKEDAIDRKIAESAQQLALNSQLDTLKTIKETNDAQLQYLMDIAANTSILAGGGGRFTPPGDVVPIGYGSGFATVPTISSDILIGTKHNAGITISIGGITVLANSIAAGQAAGRAAAYEIEAVLANAARQRNLGL